MLKSMYTEETVLKKYQKVYAILNTNHNYSQYKNSNSISNSYRGQTVISVDARRQQIHYNFWYNE